MIDALKVSHALAPLPVRVVPSCASTNAQLLSGGGGGAALLVAEHQTRGRGTRGRRWHSAPGTGLLMSLRHGIARPARELSGLSLAAGVAVLRGLRALGLEGASLKWPNDILVDGAKLGGILVETRVGESAAVAVIGCGINWHATPQGLPLRLAAACVAGRLRPTPARTDGAIAIARELLAAIDEFEREGLDAFREEWESSHAHAGCRVRVRLAGGRVMTGTAEGLGRDGSLRLRNRAGLHAVHSGTVSPA